MTTAFTCVLDVRASLGECPVWSAPEQALFWVDIKAPSLNRFDANTCDNTVMPMPETIGSFALRKAGGFVVALRSGIWLCNGQGKLERRVVDAPYDTRHIRFNDGRADRQGRFVVGTMNEKHEGSDAALYRMDVDFKLTTLFGGITIANGLAWSPDSRTMYHADTPTHTVRAFDYDVKTGSATRARTFAHFDRQMQRPDGAAVDSAGNYWIALYGDGRLAQLTPDGKLIAYHPVPAMCPTMCAFGGADLRTLFVTSARQKRDPDELARFPQSGGIFARRVDTPGINEALMRV